jgi:hypothetical protein
MHGGEAWLSMVSGKTKKRHRGSLLAKVVEQLDKVKDVRPGKQMKEPETSGHELP